MLGNGWTYLILGRTKESVDHYTRRRKTQCLRMDPDGSYDTPMDLKQQQREEGAERRTEQVRHLLDSIVLACLLLVMAGCMGQAESDAGQSRSPVSSSRSAQESDPTGVVDQQERHNASSADDRPLLADSVYHVYPGDDIQEVLEIAAQDAAHKTVVVHAGTYRPRRHGQAMTVTGD